MPNDQITINLTDTIPPQNQATIDLNGDTGNTYDKTQLDTKLGEAKLGVKGSAKQANSPTIYDPIVFPFGLFESYKVVEPITSPNNWGNLTVTQTELDENTVYFNVENGVVTKFKQPIISGKSAYELAVDNGFVGTEAEWLETLKPSSDLRKALRSFEDSTVTDFYNVVFDPPADGFWRNDLTPVIEADSAFSRTGVQVANLHPNAKKIKVTGDFTDDSSIIAYMAGYNSYTNVVTVIYSGSNTDSNELIIDVDRVAYDGYLFSFKDGTPFTLQEEITTGTPTEEDAVKKYIDDENHKIISLINTSPSNPVSGANAAIIDAYSKWGVSPTNTAAGNSVAMNNAINDAYVSGRKIILPAAVIEHNGFIYKEGVNIEGAGMWGTVLKSMSADAAFKDLDTSNTNIFIPGSIRGLSLDGNNIGTIGLELSNSQDFITRDVLFIGFTNHAVKFIGQLQHSFYDCLVNSCSNGFLILAADSTYYGYMQSNLLQYQNVYFSQIDNLCMDFDRASNVALRSCNFEACGIYGNENTGAVRARRMSPANEGIDFTFDNCWSEGVRGAFLNISESTGGTTSIRDTMVFSHGNGGGLNSGSAIINNGAKVLITGSTAFKGFTTSVTTKNNGTTRMDGLVTIGTTVEETGGTFKSASYT